MNSAIRPSESSSTWSAHGLVPAVVARLVLTKRRRTVRLPRGDDPRPLAADPWPEPPGEDVVPPREPHVERWHRLRRVLLDQRRERVDVVPLERVDVAREHCVICLVELGGRAFGGDVARGQCRPRSLQCTVHGRDARVEQLSDLCRLPPQHLAEDQDGPLPRRKVLQRGDEREANRLVLDRDVGGIRDRLDPGHLGRDVQVALDRLSRRAEVHRHGAPLPAAQHVEADVRGDPVEPRFDRGPALEAVEAAPGPDERLLDSILGFERRGEHPVGVRGQLRAVPLELGLELAGDGGRRFRHRCPC